MNILFIGDIVGSTGRQITKLLLPELIREYNLDFVLANSENVAGGSGITPHLVKELLSYGIDVLTSGDHIWKRKEIFSIIDNEPALLRPANYSPYAPGRGWNVFKKGSLTLGVINLLGRVFMDALLDCPFRVAMQAYQEISLQTKNIIVDIHAEATSEKVALGWYLDGLVSAVLGTHTHIPTSDEKILPQGTAYITDVGMTGAQRSVIGRRIEDVLKRFVSGLPQRFEVAEEEPQLQAVYLKINEASGKAELIQPIKRGLK